jgi:hypothetical protein
MGGVDCAGPAAGVAEDAQGNGLCPVGAGGGADAVSVFIESESDIVSLIVLKLQFSWSLAVIIDDENTHLVTNAEAVVVHLGGRLLADFAVDLHFVD